MGNSCFKGKKSKSQTYPKELFEADEQEDKEFYKQTSQVIKEEHQLQSPSAPVPSLLFRNWTRSFFLCCLNEINYRYSSSLSFYSNEFAPQNLFEQ